MGLFFTIFIGLCALWATPMYFGLKNQATSKLCVQGIKIKKITSKDGIELYELVDPPANLKHNRFFTATAAEEYVRTATGAN